MILIGDNKMAPTKKTQISAHDTEVLTNFLFEKGIKNLEKTYRILSDMDFVF